MATIIQSRFDAARKLFGNNDEITTASGVKVRGRYVLCESGAVTPSHNPLDGFRKSEDFPLDANGQTVNDRDYERDTDAQRITRTIAADYDSRALQTPVVVTKDGIVLSGNGRTMAGIIAARDNTDKAYIEYLSRYPQQYGFRKEDIETFKHPRIFFIAEDDFPYNAETFAMFNAQEIKAQSKTEQAVKLGKLVTDDAFSRILRNINTFDTIADFYANTRAATEAVNELRQQGIISQMQYPEMFDGDSISTQARELLENVLIGKAFQAKPDAVRYITKFKGVRKNIVTALSEISNNIALREYSLRGELSQAIELMYQARTNGGMAHGDKVSIFARQLSFLASTPTGLVGCATSATTVADCNNTTVLILADLINSTQVSKLKRIYAIYNQQATDAANGQTDMFAAGKVRTKKEIIDDVFQTLASSSTKETSQLMQKAIEQRKMKALQQQYNKQEDERDKTEKQRLNDHIGTVVALNLPAGNVIPVKLEYLHGQQAGIRLKGFYRCLVTENIITTFAPAFIPKISMPAWWHVGTKLTNGTTISDISKSHVSLSDGTVLSIIETLLTLSPAIAGAA